MKLTKIFILILIIGLISACGSQPTEAPASQPIEEIVQATQTPPNLSAPTDTNIPPTKVPTEVPTEVPTAEPTSAPLVAPGISFANDIMPILQSRCINCHGGERLEEGLSLKSYEHIMAGSNNGTVVVPGDANGSLLAELVVTQKMPKRGPKLTPPQIQLIVDWINQGALNN